MYNQQALCDKRESKGPNTNSTKSATILTTLVTKANEQINRRNKHLNGDAYHFQNVLRA